MDIIAMLFAAVITGIIIAKINIYINFMYQRQSCDDFILIEVYLLRKLIIYRLEIPVIIQNINIKTGEAWIKTQLKTSQGYDESHPHREQRFLRRVWAIFSRRPRKLWHIYLFLNKYAQAYSSFIYYLRGKIICNNFYWRTRIGNSDAAITGFATGLLWIIKTRLVKRLAAKLKFTTRPVIDIKPLFNRTVFEVEFRCIFSISIGNVINAVTYLLYKTLQKMIFNQD